MKTRGSLIKGLAILEAFLKGESELGLSELAGVTGMTVSTVHRVISILKKKGYIQQAHKRGKYSLTIKFLDFANAVNTSIKIKEISHPFMLKLRDIASESVVLAIWDESGTVHVDAVNSHHSLQVSPILVTEGSLHNTGVGKILLANKNDTDIDEFLTKTILKQTTPNTIVDMNTLKKQISIIRQEGVAFDEEERVIGVGNVSAPIKNSAGILVGAIGILGPTSRLYHDRLVALAPLVKDFALQISRELGYKD